MLPATLKTRGLHTVVRFAPRVALDKQHKQQFQLKANEGFDWRRQEFTEQSWQLSTPQSEGDPRSQLKFSVLPDLVNFEDYFPTAPFDLYLDNLKLALDSFAAVFDPRLLVGSGTVVRFTAQSETKDARIYLGQHCLHLDERLKPLQRPVHAVGLKLLLPPMPPQPEEDLPNWQAEVKLETLVEDVAQLFIEVDARWANPVNWDTQVILERVRTAQAFTLGPVVNFLQQLPAGGVD
jgi:hypothetical protein